jgi:4-diphosphocytidyl-2-C-methyl-D-erythritol kinase
MIRVTAPAKVNLVFQVGKLQENGFHPVNSLYLELDLREEITLTKGQKGTGVQIFVRGENLPDRHINSVPRDSSNLVYKVAEVMFSNAGLALDDLEIDILKRIPVAGGMAGGSADAAAMLVACNEYLHAEHQVPLLTQAELITLAAQFGSDIPFSVMGGLAIGTDRGQNLEALEPLTFDTHWVIAVSSEGLSTPAVFARFDELSQGSSFTDLSQPIASLADLVSLMANDLEEAATSLLPSISLTKSKLMELGAAKAMVSGSGPTVVGLFASAEQADQAAEHLGIAGLTCFRASASYAGTRLIR